MRLVSYALKRAVAGFLVMLLAVQLANAQSNYCNRLESQSVEIGLEVVRLLGQHPGLNLALGGCIAAAIAVYESENSSAAAAVTFGGCTILSCAFAGVDNCQEIAGRWLSLALQQAAIEEQKKQQSCS